METARALRLNKGLSQCFLVDEESLLRIAEAAIEGAPKFMPVVEIGAGAGFLTRFLLDSGHPVTAIEVDPRMVGILKSAFDRYDAFHLVHQDVLQVDFLPLLGERGLVVGNIPYHLTGPIVFLLAGELADPDYPVRQHLERVVLMVQQEVAHRLAAQPGDKAYGQLTVQVQFWFDAELVFHVPKSAFYPQPKVDSAVVKLTPRRNPAVQVQDLAVFSRLVKTAFAHRRKTLINNLKLGQYGSDQQLKTLLQEVGISSMARPQEVSIKQFGALADAVINPLS